MTFTKERLTELSRRENVGAILGEEIAELARIALASLEAEAVAWLLSGGGAKNNVSFDSGNAYADPLREVTPLYTAHPAPVSVPAAMEMDDDFDSAFEHGKAVGWNACRAAMLQGAEPVTPAYKSPDDFDFDRFNDVVWLEAVASNPHMHSLTTSTIAMVALELNRKLADCNSPVIPGCSCLTCRPLTFSDSRFVVCPECGNKRCPHANDHRNACTGSNEPGQEGSAYPAAPQQE